MALTVKSDVERILHNRIDADLDTLKKYETGLTRLMEVLDPMLDKPYEGDPKYTCGDFLEKMQEALHGLGESYKYTKRIVTAMTIAWSLYPEEISYSEDCNDYVDKNADMRWGYIRGYMCATDTE